ncbi:MAG: hypothetical protein RLZZ338_4320, partial [Cyanobacteriota bacterium]
MVAPRGGEKKRDRGRGNPEVVAPRGGEKKRDRGRGNP